MGIFILKCLIIGFVMFSIVLIAVPVFISSNKAIVSIFIIPPNSKIKESEKLQFIAFAQYADDSGADITEDVSWYSSDTSLLAINDSGLAAGLKEGRVEIFAAYGKITAGVQVQVERL